MLGVDESIKMLVSTFVSNIYIHMDCERLNSKNFTVVGLTETGINIKDFLVYDQDLKPIEMNIRTSWDQALFN